MLSLNFVLRPASPLCPVFMKPSLPSQPVLPLGLCKSKTALCVLRLGPEHVLPCTAEMAHGIVAESSHWLCELRQFKQPLCASLLYH